MRAGERVQKQHVGANGLRYLVGFDGVNSHRTNNGWITDATVVAIYALPDTGEPCWTLPDGLERIHEIRFDHRNGMGYERDSMLFAAGVAIGQHVATVGRK